MKPLKRGQREDLHKPMSGARKAKERRWPEPLEVLAKMERVTPGKLASWIRAQPLMHPMPGLRAAFINVVKVECHYPNCDCPVSGPSAVIRTVCPRDADNASSGDGWAAEVCGGCGELRIECMCHMHSDHTTGRET